MKTIFYFLVIGLFLSCDKDSQNNNNNPYLPNYNFSTTVNLNLPEYNSLQFPGNAVYIGTAAVGIRGIFVLNTGSGYVALEAACPNQALSNCSTMVLNGINAVCPCDNVSYSLFTGQASGMPYAMIPYRTEMINATTLRVYN